MKIKTTNWPLGVSESGLIRRIERASPTSRNHNSGLKLAIGDDAAIWKPRAGFETVLTTDWFLEGTHFLRKFHPPDSVGWKCLARAVSDVAAMGAEPRCFLLSLSLPENCTGKWLDGFLRGMKRAAEKLHCGLAGGDTTRRDQILINITVIGEIERGKAVMRSGAQSGDRIFVSGRLGEAEIGWKLTKSSKRPLNARNELFRKHLYPEPRIRLGLWLAKNKLVSAMMDISDGLSSDLARLCRASEVGAVINGKNIPIPSSKFLSKVSEMERFAAALHGGDDYELLFCVSKKHLRKIPSKFLGIALTEIGEITKRPGVRLVDSAGNSVPLRDGGWDPFRN